MIVLRDYQAESVEALRANIREGVRNQVLCAPTGAGKTVIAAYLLGECMNKRKRAVFVADRIALIDQTSATLDKYGIAHGVIQGQHWRYRPYERIQVASAQTLAKRGWPDADLIIVDEAHALQKTVTDRIARRDVVTIGLTATPFTKGLGRHYDSVVSVTTTNKLTDAGHLVPFRVFAASEPDMTGAKVVAGEWTEDEAAKRAMPIVGDCVSEYLKHGEGKKFIAFGCNVAHCEELQRQFMSAGIQAELYTYQTGDEVRTQLVEEFRKPDSYVRGLVSISALSKGFDCIAEGSMVLTDTGNKPIETISLQDKLWDGHEFVSHGGVVFKGERSVITYAGLTATPDHQVKTKEGWRSFFDCAKETISIVETANCRGPVQEHEGRFRGGKRKQENKCFDVFVSLHGLRRRIRSGAINIAHTAMGWLQSMYCAELASKKNAKRKIAVREQEPQRIYGLRWSWDTVQFSIFKESGGMGLGKSWSCGTEPSYADRQDRQRWKLRARKYPLGDKTSECMQHTTRRMGSENTSIQNHAPRDTLCGQNASEPVFGRHECGGNYREIPQEVRQAKRRVWDILNSGPRNSFTCEGLLVHNCSDVEIIIMARPLRSSLAEHIQILGRGLRPHDGKGFCTVLDHAGNMARFWTAMEDFFEVSVHELDDGKPKPEKKKKEKPEKEPVKCPQCKCMHNPMPVCPQCGHTYPRRKSEVEHQPGELTEIGAKKKVTMDEKLAWYAQLRGIAQERNYKPGWAFHKYKAKFGKEPPSGMEPDPAMPSPEVMRWVRSQQIAYAKSKR